MSGFEWTPPEAFDGCECECHLPGVVMMHCVPCCYPGWRDRKPIFAGAEFKTIPGIYEMLADQFAEVFRKESIAFAAELGIDLQEPKP